MSKRFSRLLAELNGPVRQAPLASPAPAPAPSQAPSGDYTDLLKLLEPEPQEPSALELYAPMAVRGLSGLVGAAPGIGALATGAGEIAAQGIEGRFSPAEIAAAAAVGAAGGGLARTVMAAKTPLQAAARALPWAAGAPVAQSLIAEGELPTLGEVGTSAAIGAGTAGAMGKLFEVFGVGGYGKAKAPKAPDAAYEIDASVPRGGAIRRKGNHIVPDAAPAPIKSPLAGQPLNPVAATAASGTDEATQMIEQLQDYQRAAGHANDPAMQDPNGLASNRAENAVRRQKAEQRAANRDEALARKEQERLQREQDAQAAIEEAKASGMEVSRPVITQTFRAAQPDGSTETLVQRWATPDEEGAVDDLLEQATGARPQGTPSPTVPAANPVPVSAIAPEQAPQAPTATSAPLAGATTPTLETELTDALSGLLGPAPATGGTSAAPGWLKAGPEGRAYTRGQSAELTALENEGSPDSLLGALQGMLTRRGAPRTIAPEAPPAVAPAPTSPGLQGMVDANSTQSIGPKGSPVAPDRPDPLAAMLTDKLAKGEASLFPRDPNDVPLTGAPEAPAGDPLQFFKSRVDAMGSHYRGIGAAAKAGETIPVEPLTGRNPARIAGMGLQREAAGAGLPTRQSPMARDMNVATTAPQGPPLDLKAALAAIDAAKGRPGAGANNLAGGGYGGLSSFLRGESGQAAPEAMVNLGLMGAFAAGGAALNEDDPVTGAIIGGGIGAGAAYALPRVATELQSLARHARVDPATVAPETRSLLERIQTQDGLATTAKEAFQLVPAYIRANLLATPNIFSNAFIAPYGAGLMRGIEAHLAGDPKGIEMLRAMTPQNFANRWMKSWNEAEAIIADAELASLERAGGATNPNSKLGRLLGGPGTMITTGDITTRNLLKEGAGLSDDAARHVTMNNEPEAATSQGVLGMQRKAGVIGQILLPFAKTMLNYTEQGLQRTPVVGLVAQALRENPDPLTHIMVQQMMGTTALGAGIAGGYYDPTSDPRSTKLLRGAGVALAGPYGLMANAGYTAGQALKQGESKTRAAHNAVTTMQRQMPMPSWDLVNSGKDFILPLEASDRKVPTEFLPGMPMYRSVKPPETGRKPRGPKQPKKPRE
jgi:hypothetical protein